jgi:hypothetical protein
LVVDFAFFEGSPEGLEFVGVGDVEDEFGDDLLEG